MYLWILDLDLDMVGANVGGGDLVMLAARMAWLGMTLSCTHGYVDYGQDAMR